MLSTQIEPNVYVPQSNGFNSQPLEALSSSEPSTLFLNILNTILVACLLLLCANVQAKDKRHGFKDHSSHDWAKVTHYEPITRTREIRTPEKNCWYEQVDYDTYDYPHQSHTGTIVGGIIGGALGNAVGHKKKNKQIGTAVGAILGATIGHDISSRDRKRTKPLRHSRSEKHCEVTQHISYEEEVVGYKVWYRYHGETYKTRMDHKPGKRIKVRVTVKPV